VNSKRVVLIPGLGIAAAIGYAIGRSPAFGFAATAGLLITIGIVISARVRLLIVLAGGLLVFQSDSEVGATKYAYLTAIILATGLSLLRLARSREPVLTAFRPLLPASAGLLLIIGSSAFVARGSGTSMTNWSRDVLPYLLVALLPAVGLDAAQDVSGKNAERLLVVAGFVAAAGFALDWLSRRGVSSLGVGRIVLATSTLAALGFAYSLTKAGLGPHRPRWLLASTAILTLMLISGTRTNIFLLAAAVGVAGSRASLRVPARRILGLILQIVAAVAVVLPLVASALIDNPVFFQSRISGAMSVITGQGAPDQSFVERQRAYAVARDTFLQFPWFGVGPGHTFTTSALGLDSASLDTPWIVPAKLGVIGVVALMIYIATVMACVRRLRKLAGWSTLVTAGLGWAATLLALFPFGPWIEDKGFAIALAVYLAALVATARDSLAVKSTPRQVLPAGPPKSSEASAEQRRLPTNLEVQYTQPTQASGSGSPAAHRVGSGVGVLPREP
jgi:hypothetical protein